jgi:DNA primase
MLQQISEACQYILQHEKIAAKAQTYLNSRLPRNIQQEFGFGFFPSDQNLDYLTSFVDKAILEEARMVYPKYEQGGTVLHGHLNDHPLTLPFYDVNGRVISLMGRTLLSEEERSNQNIQKYKYSLDSNKDIYVYGLNKSKEYIIEKNYVIGVEGQFDLISLYMNGVKNVVAFGSANVSDYQMFQIHRYSNNVVLLLDNDEAGKNAKIKIKKKYSKWVNVKTASPPKGYKDIEEFLRKTEDEIQKRALLSKLASLEWNG